MNFWKLWGGGGIFNSGIFWRVLSAWVLDIFGGSVCGYIMCWSGLFSVVPVVGMVAVTSRLPRLGGPLVMHLVKLAL